MRKNSEDKNKSKSRKQEPKLQSTNDNDRKLSKKALPSLSGLVKIKNRIQHTVNPNKILQLIKKGTKSIPQLLTKEQSKALLPKLDTIILPHVSNGKSQSKSKFQQIESQLTCSMVLFTKNAEVQKNDLWAIDMQTQKCYKVIPAIYFQENMEVQGMKKFFFPKNKFSETQEQILLLGDYFDQVQFNINQQVNSKIKIFMNFVQCTNSIQDLIAINTEKLSKTRRHIGILRDIIVSRSVRINQQRFKKQRIQETLNALLLLKKLKGIENKLNAQIVLGSYISHDNRTKLGILFNQYCHLHNIELKRFCCKTGKSICKYWDITYYVERGFQDNFMKIIKSYLCQIINCQNEIQQVKKYFSYNKKTFMSTPSNSNQAQFQMEQSFEVDAYDHVELITKIHIEKEIVALFEQGMEKYSFSTQTLEKELKQHLSSYINNFLKDSIQIFLQTDSKSFYKSLTQYQSNNFVDSEKCKEKLIKLNWGYFTKVTDMIIVRFEYLSIRLLSLFDKILLRAQDLQECLSERYQVICAYLTQLIQFVLCSIDEYLEKILRAKSKDSQKSSTLFKSRQQIIKEFEIESENFKKLIKYCNKWIAHVQNLQKSYSLTKRQYDKFAVKSDRNNMMQCNPWGMKVQQLKSTLVKNSYQMFHKAIINREIREKLQEDKWQYIEVKTDIYNNLGYIIGGKSFLFEEERSHKDSLSKSILIDKSMTESQRAANKYKKQEYSSRFKINPTYITLGKSKYRITAGTQKMIELEKRYLQLYDDIIDSQKKTDLLAKMTELIIVYSHLIKDFILKGEALKFEKIKAKSITAKHLLITYTQLQLIQTIFTGELIQSRIGYTKYQCQVMQKKLQTIQQQICKKYRQILQLRIEDRVQSLSAKEENWLKGETVQSISKNFQSSIQLFQEFYLNQQQFEKFVDLDSKWVADLINKIGKGSKGRQNIIACFQFLDQQFLPFYKYLPRLKVAIKSVLS